MEKGFRTLTSSRAKIRPDSGRAYEGATYAPLPELSRRKGWALPKATPVDTRTGVATAALTLLVSETPVAQFLLCWPSFTKREILKNPRVISSQTISRTNKKERKREEKGRLIGVIELRVRILKQTQRSGDENNAQFLAKRSNRSGEAEAPGINYIPRDGGDTGKELAPWLKRTRTSSLRKSRRASGRSCRRGAGRQLPGGERSEGSGARGEAGRRRRENGSNEASLSRLSCRNNTLSVHQYQCRAIPSPPSPFCESIYAREQRGCAYMRWRMRPRAPRASFIKFRAPNEFQSDSIDARVQGEGNRCMRLGPA